MDDGKINVRQSRRESQARRYRVNRNHLGANRIINDAIAEPHNQTANDQHEPQERLLKKRAITLAGGKESDNQRHDKNYRKKSVEVLQGLRARRNHAVFDSVKAQVALRGFISFRVDARHIERTIRPAVAAPDAFAFVDDDRAAVFFWKSRLRDSRAYRRAFRNAYTEIL